mgnify:CR=1 FL=1
MHLRVSREVLIMDQVQALVNAVEAAQADENGIPAIFTMLDRLYENGGR